jgi:hypothetical protein
MLKERVSRIKKVLTILLAVLFIVSVTGDKDRGGDRGDHVNRDHELM